MLAFLLLLSMGYQSSLAGSRPFRFSSAETLTPSSGRNYNKVIITAVPLETYNPEEAGNKDLLQQSWDSSAHRFAREGFIPPSSLKVTSCSTEDGSSSVARLELLIDFIPATSFSCSSGQSGYFADYDTSCRAFHYCHNETVLPRAFLCPPCTLFNEETLLCDFWYNVKCQMKT